VKPGEGSCSGCLCHQHCKQQALLLLLLLLTSSSTLLQLRHLSASEVGRTGKRRQEQSGVISRQAHLLPYTQMTSHFLSQTPLFVSSMHLLRC